MNVTSKNKLFALLLTLLLAMSLVACGSDPADDLLNDYEKFVVKCEDMAKQPTISQADAQKLAQEIMDFGNKAQKDFTADTKLNEAQTKRYTDLSQRLMTAFQSIQTKGQ